MAGLAAGLVSGGCLGDPSDYAFDSAWDPANSALDLDGDGIPNGEDRCPERPLSDETCNGLDDDCDGQTDEGLVGPVDPEMPAPERLVQVCPGEFLMGSPDDEPGRAFGETRHRVELSRPFLIRATEVTQAEWEAVMGGNPSRFPECGPSCPVETVSWHEAVAFCNALSRSEGVEECYAVDGSDVFWPRGLDCEGWRLPTEAEWEYAARAGTQTAYHSGSEEAALGRAGWYADNPGGTTHPVGGKEPNAWGLFDVHGNVWEWVWDRYGSYEGDATDPIGPRSGDDRVIRGGSWDSYARYCRAAFRFRLDPGYRLSYLGFRPARSVSR